MYYTPCGPYCVTAMKKTDLTRRHIKVNALHFLWIFVVFVSTLYNDPFPTAYFKEVVCVAQMNRETFQSILRYYYIIFVGSDENHRKSRSVQPTLADNRVRNPQYQTEILTTTTFRNCFVVRCQPITNEYLSLLGCYAVLTEYSYWGFGGA